MKSSFRWLAFLAALIPLLPGPACQRAAPGTGNLAVSVQPLTTNSQITRVSVTVTPANLSTDLARDPSGTFSGLLTIPTGLQTVNASAWAGTIQVGTGSNTVTVLKGQLASVTITVTDGTGPAPVPDHSPVITSFNVPAGSATVSDQLSLSATAFDADNAPITWSWSVSPPGCGSYSSPSSPSTIWTALVAGTCRVTVTATAKGKSDSKSADIAVAPKPTFSISGTITNGSGASVALSGASSATTTADASGNYSFTLLFNGSYVVTPTKAGYTMTPASQSVTVAGANQTGINFTASVTANTLRRDVTVTGYANVSSTSVATSALSTVVGNELLLAFIATDYVSLANTTVTAVTGGGLTWRLVVRTNVQSGTSEIWRAFSPAVLSNVTVSATLSQSVLSSITVMSFAGVNTTGTDGSGAIGATGSGNGSTGAPSVSLTTTQGYSWVFGVGNDFDNAIARTPQAGQSIVSQHLTATGDTYWVQMQDAPTPAAGTLVGISDTAPTTDRWNLSIVEVLPAGVPVPSFTISGNITPAASGAGTTVNLTGTASMTTTADGSGIYSFTVLANGSYTVTPVKSGYTFSPSSQTVVVNGANVSVGNFIATVSPSFFFDDFLGTSLSADWTVISRHGEYTQSETECNVPEQVSVSGGALTITTARRDAVCGDFNPDGTQWHAPATWPYVTGDIQWKSLNFTYGTIEIRARFPLASASVWPATWLLDARCQATNPFTGESGVATCPPLGAGGYTEIDMTECYGNSPYCQFHVANPGFGLGNGCDAFYTNLNDSNYHVFKTVWTASSITQYMDGALITTCNQNLNKPMFLLIQIQTGGVGGTPVDANLPATLVVDYAKVTQP